MEIIYGCKKPLRPNVWPVVTLGVFDGVHRGHLKVIGATVALAKEKNGKSIVLTFSKSPKVVLGKRPSSIITTLEHRLSIFKRLGVDITIIMEFDDVANITANDFIKNVLHEMLGIKGVVLGYNCSFGAGRGGDKAMVYELADAFGYEVHSCDPVTFNNNVISSTLIRKAIMQGDLNSAEDMLGRPVTIMGTVVSGSQRGSKVLFPTANLNLHHEVMPPIGVYGTVARLGEEELYAITNIGMRPTFEGEPFADNNYPETVVEVHILNFSESIYGRDMEVQFVIKIRPERKFDNIDELKRQIENDISTFTNYIKKTRPVSSPTAFCGTASRSDDTKSAPQKFLDMSKSYTYNAAGT